MTPDEAIFDRLERSRIQPRMQIAVTVLALGESYRASAHAVGLRDHRNLQRHAKRLGFDALHRTARYRRQLERMGRDMEALLERLPSLKARSLEPAYRKAWSILDTLRR